MHGKGSATDVLDEAPATELLPSRVPSRPQLDGKRVLVLIPDGTAPRPDPAPVPAAARGARRTRRAARLPDRARHPSADVRCRGGQTGRRLSSRPSRTVSETSRSSIMPGTAPTRCRRSVRSPLRRSSSSRKACSARQIEVTLNRRILDYDQLIICGPVFPHEVAGFSGGAKYLFPASPAPTSSTPATGLAHW